MICFDVEGDAPMVWGQYFLSDSPVFDEVVNVNSGQSNVNNFTSRRRDESWFVPDICYN